MESPLEVLVAGHICLDLCPSLGGDADEPFEAAFRPGKLVVSGPITYTGGGLVSNTGLALHQLGIQTRLVGKIGADLFGRELRQIFAAHGEGLDEGLLVDSASRTAYTIIINYPGVDRIFLHDPASNEYFGASDIPFELLPRCRLFHFGYPPLLRSTYINGGMELKRIFAEAKRTGVTTSLDMSLPGFASEAGQVDWRSILKVVLPDVDIFLPSVEETLFMLRREEYLAMCKQSPNGDILPLVIPTLLSSLGRELLSMGVRVVGLKLGARGLYLRTGSESSLRKMGRAVPSEPRRWAGRELWAPCFQVQVAGTTGAGDSTIAGFLAGLLRGLTLEDAINAAVAVGACRVESADTLNGIRSLEETLARLRQGWERHSLELDAPGWHFDPACSLWRGPCAV